MTSGCAGAVESRVPNRGARVICRRIGGEFDMLVRAPALKVELSAVQGEGWGNFWLPCGFPD